MLQAKLVRISERTFLFNNFCFRKSCRVWVPWRNIAESDRSQIIWRMRVACRISESTNILSEYVTLTAFWLHEYASVLRYKHTAGLEFLFSIIICRLYQLTHSDEAHVPLPLTVSLSNVVETFLAFPPLLEGPKNSFHQGPNLLSAALPALQN
jgi:hypothetical protein